MQFASASKPFAAVRMLRPNRQIARAGVCWALTPLQSDGPSNSRPFEQPSREATRGPDVPGSNTPKILLQL